MTKHSSIDPKSRFFFYQSDIGNLEPLIHKYVLPEIKSTPGFLTNAFGVKVNPRHLPTVIGERDGVEPPPIPANWHADIAEFGSALRAVDLAVKNFTVIELGCGWGCWLNITGVVARRKGLDVKLVGVEGDNGHIAFAHESLQENGFSSDDYVIHHGIASWQDGVALFPIQDQSGHSWGLEACFDVPHDKVTELLNTGKFKQLKQIPISSLIPKGREIIDLLHIDIQGAEIPLIPNSMSFISEKVAMVLVGTHSKRIEADLFECFLKAGWILEVERPAILSVGHKINTIVDGVQLWRNPLLISGKTDQLSSHKDYAGEIKIISHPDVIAAGEYFFVKVLIFNLANKNWCGNNPNPVLISYHWVNAEGNMVVYDGERTPPSNNIIEANGRVEQSVKVLAPGVPGCFRLIITLVHEGVCWFENKSFTPAVTDLIIN